MAVSTEDLSADFGRFLKLARSGEVVVIVDDGNPVALLEPIDEARTCGEAYAKGGSGHRDEPVWWTGSGIRRR